MKKNRLFIFALLCVFFVTTVGTTVVSAEDDTFRVAAVLPCSIDDGVFCQHVYESLQRMKDKLGDSFEFTFVENVYEVVDIEPALRDYASQGYDLVLGHGFQFQDPILNVAKDYPEVAFGIGPASYLAADNVVNYDINNFELGYGYGVIASYLSDSKKAGFVAGLEVPNTTSAIDGMEKAAQDLNSGLEVKSLIVGSFDDAEGARELANAAIEQGTDFIVSNMNNSAALEAAEANGVYGVTTGSLYDLYPNAMVISAPSRYDILFEMMMDDIAAGKFGNKQYQLTFANGGLEIVLRDDIDQTKADNINAVLDELRNGTKTVTPE